QYVVVAVFCDASAHREYIRSSVWFAGAVGPDKTAVAQSRQIFLLLLGGAVYEQRDRIGPHVSIDRKEQPLIGRAVTQPFHNGNGGDGIRAAAAEFFGNRQALHAEGGAFFPSIIGEDPLSVAFNHVAAQFSAGKIDRCFLERE